MIGGFIAPYIRKITPRAALLGTLAGVSVTFISMRPALEMYMTPQIGLVCFAIILVSWFGGVKYPRDPRGPGRHCRGYADRLGSNLFGLGLGGLSVKGVGEAFARLRFFRAAAGHRPGVLRASEFLGASWSRRSRSASTISWRRWTTSRARRPPATNIRRRASSQPTAWSA